MSAEELLVIAREFCAVAGARITNFAALCAASAAAGARIDGIAVHASPRAAADALAGALTAYPALSGANGQFAALCAAIYVARCS